MKNNFTIFILLTLFSILSLPTSFSQSWANDNGGVYNIPAEEYNPRFHGYGSTDNVIYNKIDLQNGQKMEIKNSNGSAPLYDYLGNQVDVAWNSPIGRDIGNIEPDGYTFRDGGIIAASIAQIRVGNTNHTMAYAWSVNTRDSGRRSGWIKLTDLTPSTSIKNILEDNKDARMDILEDGGINDATYDEHNVVSAFLPSSINEYYVDPGRSATKTAGKARFYYTVEEHNGNYISGVKNIPETSRQRFGVAINNIPVNAKFYKDRNYPIVKLNIYPPDSYVAESHQLEFAWGYTVANSGEKIYSFINRRTLQATGNNDVTGEEEEEENNDNDDNGNGDEFIPDPNKEYYIDNPANNKRLASTGQSEDPYTTSTSTTGSNVQWKFVAKGNGYWHIQRAAGGAKPRLRTDNTAYADMQETSSSLTYTYFHFPKGKNSGTYHAVLPHGPANYKRLQIRSSGDVKMVSDAGVGTWESFKFTVVSSTSSPTIKNIAPDGTASQISTDFGGVASRAIDKNKNGAYWQNSVTHTKNQNNAYWQVKWSDNYVIDQIKIYNRTDCCASRLSNFKVLVYNASGNVVFTSNHSGTAGASLTVNTGGVTGKHVRIQLNGTNHLSLTEVEVYGYPTNSLQSRSSSADDSFIHAYKKTGRKVGLNWMVSAAEIPTHYEIEHSKADGEFELLETVSANQNDDKEVYNFLHDTPEDGQNNYRVKMIFQDGAEAHLEPLSINFESIPGIMIFPNPTEGRLFVDLSEYMGGAVDLYLTDFSGQLRLTEKLEKDHAQVLDLDLSAFQNGFYMLSIKGKNRQAISKKISLISTY